MNCVIYGDEKLLMNQRLNTIKRQFHIQEDDMNLMTYWCDETPMNEIIEDALTPPFLTDYKMIVMKNPFFLTSQKQKGFDQKDLDVLLDYVQHDNPSTILILYLEGKLDERKKIVKELRKKMKFYHLEKPDDHQLFQIVHQSIKARHCEIDDDALELFLSRMPHDLLEIAQEVKKLCLYRQHIDVDAVEKIVSPRLEDNVFELTKAILNKETAMSLKIYQDLKTNNEEPIKLIVLIANSLRLLYQVKLLDRKGYNDQEIAKILSINPYRLKYIRQDGKSYDLNELLGLIDQLSQLDVSIKTGQIDKYKGLELFLIQGFMERGLV